ncbi:MAG TPA: alkaline phosphatase family protein [Candidatus Hydrogenedentes bacterium]|nr:alkaline phosphatase family protein [Candidatus Hydrogenedentota bacterium]
MTGHGLTRRQFLAGTAAAAVVGTTSAAQTGGRVIILGFDGVKPEVVEHMLDAGELPNLAKLKQAGAYSRLRSSNPPQSPTAWSSFASCTWAGNHGIFDFLRRTPETYMPGLGFGMTTQPELNGDGSLKSRAKFVSFRKGKAFWATASERGLRCKILELPYAYPPDNLPNGCQLCGLDVPDLRGTQTTSFAISETIQEVENVAGGVRLPLVLEGDKATVSIPGFRSPITKEYLEVPMGIAADRAGRTVTVEIQGASVTLKENGWSDWFEWSFAVSPKYSVRGISRIHVLEAGNKVRLYMTCLQCHPRDPYVPISHPDAYAGELADRYGLYKTIGWAFDTKALERDDMPEDLFLDDIRMTMAWRERLMLDELERGDFDLLIAGWTGTDRVGHMFWRFRDPKHPLYTEEGAKKWGRALEETYVKMDEIVGKVMAALKDGDLLMVMSDHGFHSSRYDFSINTWLVRNGYLAVTGKMDSATAFTEERYLQGFDWPRSKAYGLGLGSVYLNLKGREGQGVVDPAEADALLAEIREKMLQVTDPNTGEKVFSEIYTREAFQGRSADNAPDMEVGFAEGYANSKSSAAGSAPEKLIEPNRKKWSGEHAASDVALTHGILFMNRPISGEPGLVDIGPTALNHLGLDDLPPEYEGKPFV